ncbi:MAG: hypothetical protein A3G02_00485 [Candidatus Yanofskybacteria bacterium RIFCSPLOWO2_12_FULL_44_13b]|uniref:Heat-inducible transcription repressor HrcA n=2 Tax=Candidatus Yanofskyibacteriota TaxID=1752733 RepID=A0A1F8H1N7_9BACT|nr:MAG: Transcriptional regulator of heat shock protein [Candidatus Yanofskybacteria bacterium GW2011_GWA2_44_10]KKT90314.1 MAG: Transcriptional regulator of heat shock protein [Candidatus Yanofskybacteria bacterium GW2011_GWB1_45_11]OGN03650.1 MAG: hypothetical protein A2657_01640 [Candidatus Yanofskybacteria bacterium RIFCSPHIGHO2_01_FULL_44_110b]OGN14530.1 MAG: hypothetical protein A3C01_00380 [Candidatus Yanofskybacteria bacterium RIFCSPHIGHO2_02_FULL_44_36b]OGN18203.1 MAG: hypothetical pro
MLGERHLNLLNFIIEEFIETAKPVGSALAAKNRQFKVSPATIRSDMGDLEEAGLLAQLHTSGGRVPTDLAYRYYVDNLLVDFQYQLSNKCRNKIDRELSNAGDAREISHAAAKLISDISENVVISGISQEKDFFKTGISNLFDLPEFRSIDRLLNVTSFFDEFDDMFAKIERQFFSEPELSIFIGRENPMPNLRNESVMCATYELPGGLTGNLTLIGPTRMDYEKNIALIRYTTKSINKHI